MEWIVPPSVLFALLNVIIVAIFFSSRRSNTGRAAAGERAYSLVRYLSNNFSKQRDAWSDQGKPKASKTEDKPEKQYNIEEEEFGEETLQGTEEVSDQRLRAERPIKRAPQETKSEKGVSDERSRAKRPLKRAPQETKSKEVVSHERSGAESPVKRAPQQTKSEDDLKISGEDLKIERSTQTSKKAPVTEDEKALKEILANEEEKSSKKAPETGEQKPSKKSLANEVEKRGKETPEAEEEKVSKKKSPVIKGENASNRPPLREEKTQNEEKTAKKAQDVLTSKGNNGERSKAGEAPLPWRNIPQPGGDSSGEMEVPLPPPVPPNLTRAGSILERLGLTKSSANTEDMEASYTAEVDTEAESFIRRFRKELKLQRLKSMLDKNKNNSSDQQKQG
eukprot:TRINITY_DN31217_c0_g1_i1.p1 TRINITY_DN31217_c0_g1~~TRINITY_DN31217_c0_g1_i1.p1  ORF type:complete len:393 (+),score=64.88 TRINITY_DN31217_c0_g1_i1:152-1330(+)